MKPILLLFASSLLWAASEDAAAKAERARELVIAGKVEEAIPIYRQLAQAYPDDPAVLVNLSIAEFKATMYREAAGHAASALQSQSDSLPANLILGSSYVELGEYSRALSPLEKVLAMRPQERNGLVMLAETLLNLGRYEEAAGHFERASEVAPESPKVWYGLGRTFEGVSERSFHQIENTHPESPYWDALQADLFLKQRRYGSAFAHYRLALKGLSRLTGAHAALATIYQRTGHSAWAEVEAQRERNTTSDCGAAPLACDFATRRFQEVIRSAKSSTSPEAGYWACRVYTELAAESYGHLTQLPPSRESYLQRAKTLDVQGLPHEAADEWRKALTMSPGDRSVRTALAWSLFRARDFGAASLVLAELLKQKSDSRELNFLDGAVLLSLDEPQKAVAPLEVAVRLDDKFLPAQAALGQAYLQSARPSLAIPHLKLALAEDEDASTHFRLLRAYQLTGQVELAAQAKEEYQAALKLAEAKARSEEGADITAPFTALSH